jgi:hypothetical protein
LTLNVSKINLCEKKQKISQYKGVNWHRETRKWRARLRLKGQKEKSGGYFQDEIDAGKRVNQLCEELKIPPQNPGINGRPEKKIKISQYKGVMCHKQSGKWCVIICLKRQRRYGGMFNDELDAAKRVNQLCKELGISPKNPEISAIPNHKYHVTKKCFFFPWHCEKIKTVKIYTLIILIIIVS